MTPFTRRKGSFWRALAFAAIGLIVGAAFATVRLGTEMDRLTLDNAVLMDEVERLAGTLASREQALTKQKQRPVYSVEVEVTGIEEEHIRLHVEQKAHDLLRHLVGEEVSDLNASLIEKALSRTIHVDKQVFTVTPTLIVLGDKISVRLRAEEGSVEISP